MNEIFSWLGWGAGGLLLVAVAVAGWEHLVREATGRRTQCGAGDDGATGAVSVDVRLDTQAADLGTESDEGAELQPRTDRDTRLAAMTRALSRAADPLRRSREGQGWLDTTPRVVDLNEPALRGRGPEGTPGAPVDGESSESRRSQRS